MTEISPPPMRRRIRITDYTAKRQHERWAMLTSYDQYTPSCSTRPVSGHCWSATPRPTMSTVRDHAARHG